MIFKIHETQTPTSSPMNDHDFDPFVTEKNQQPYTHPTHTNSAILAQPAINPSQPPHPNNPQDHPATDHTPDSHNQQINKQTTK